MTLHTINPETLKELSSTPERTENESSRAAGAASDKAVDRGVTSDANKPQPAPQDEQSEAAKRFSRDVGKKLPPDVGSEDPL
ncbi:hypothetical protein ACO0LO_05010 [Undibacterium sp. TJN25]|uniref:hypothetical protein n=1 Tax=Undibacterium sp. TJN25 TaxID=3413056 RepID=UPI003BF20344